MALNTQKTNLAVNTEADAFARLLDNGYIKIYDGAQPATGDTAITTQTLLATLSFNATSAPAAVAGVLTFNAFTSDPDAAATGTASWFRAFKSDGTTAVYDGSVGTATANIIAPTVSIVQHAIVSITSGTHTVNKSGTGY